MKWLPRSEKREQNSKSELKYWKEGMWKRENGSKGLKARCKELKESGGFWRRNDEKSEHDDTTKRMKTRRLGVRTIEKGLRGYVQIRQKVAVLCHTESLEKRARFTTHEISPTTLITRNPTPRRCHSKPTKFHTVSRPHHQYHSRPRFRDVYRPTCIPAASEMEIWMVELWKDFLLEPTPYLVISATFYLGLFLISLQYYPTIWNIAYFLIQFIPWDDDFGAPGHLF